MEFSYLSRDGEEGYPGNLIVRVTYSLTDDDELVWQAVAQPTRVGDVCAQLLEQYDVDAATCEAEVLTFVGELRDAGLVTTA